MLIYFADLSDCQRFTDSLLTNAIKYGLDGTRTRILYFRKERGSRTPGA
jgi:hypothetical protein